MVTRLRSPISRAVPLAVAMLSLTLAGCPDMSDQPKAKNLRPSSLFANGASARPLVPGTVPRGSFQEILSEYRPRTLDPNPPTVFPFAITRADLDRGRQRFNIYCSPCHGQTGDGNGMIVQRGFPPPPSYHIDRLRNAPAGHFFDVITQGYGIMYSYAARGEPADRWAIAAYIRVLQKSQDT